VLHSFPKEPEFFTETCNFNALRCNRTAQFQYMRDVSAASRMALFIVFPKRADVVPEWSRGNRTAQFQYMRDVSG